jgi:hypothetical protein
MPDRIIVAAVSGYDDEPDEFRPHAAGDLYNNLLEQLPPDREGAGEACVLSTRSVRQYRCDDDVGASFGESVS